jgi:hypothetical protein
MNQRAWWVAGALIGGLSAMGTGAAGCGEAFSNDGAGGGSSTTSGGHGGATSTAETSTQSAATTSATTTSATTSTSTTSSSTTTSSTTTSSTTTSTTTSSSTTSSTTASVSASSSTSSSVSSSASSTGTGVVGACTSNNDCMNAASFCLITGCIPGTLGTCQPKPAFSPQPDPVCGCDGVTYWSPSVAANHGVAIHAGGECTQGFPKTKTCSLNNACVNGTKCNVQVDQLGCATAGLATGFCWSLPDCNGTTAQGKDCSNNQCASQCDLIDSNKPYYDGAGCP